MSKTVYENEDIFATEADGSGIPDYALSFAEQSLYVTAMVEENFLASMSSVLTKSPEKSSSMRELHSRLLRIKLLLHSSTSGAKLEVLMRSFLTRLRMLRRKLSKSLQSR